MQTKTCKTCGDLKDKSNFYKHPRTKDRLGYECKDCALIRSRKYYAENRDRILADAASKNKITDNKAARLYAKRNPEKKRAHTAAYKAVKTGILKKPSCCSICGVQIDNLQKHHSDYNKPLDVIWMCSGCHGKVSRKVIV